MISALRTNVDDLETRGRVRRMSLDRPKANLPPGKVGKATLTRSAFDI
jgi:hypothetical protein